MFRREGAGSEELPLTPDPMDRAFLFLLAGDNFVDFFTIIVK